MWTTVTSTEAKNRLNALLTGSAARRGDLDAVEPVVAVGGLLVGQVVVLDQPERVVIRG
jgi:hypothetical protein